MGKDYTVDCASQQAVCPVGEQVADVEENWGEGSLSVLEGRRSFRIVALGYDRDGRPFLFFCLLPLGSVCGRDRIVQHGGVVGEDLQTGLRGSLEQEGYGSCSRADQITQTDREKQALAWLTVGPHSEELQEGK